MITTTVVVGSIMVASLFVQAPQPASAEAPLSAQDYAEIRQLSVRYAEALDNCLGRAFAELFTADGVFSFGSRRLEGRERLAGLMQSERYCQEHTQSPDNHLPSNVVVKATARGATGKAYLPVTGTGAGGGFYEDVYIRTQDGWRFKLRNYVSAKQAASQDGAGQSR